MYNRVHSIHFHSAQQALVIPLSLCPGPRTTGTVDEVGAIRAWQRCCAEHRWPRRRQARICDKGREKLFPAPSALLNQRTRCIVWLVLRRVWRESMASRRDKRQTGGKGNRTRIPRKHEALNYQRTTQKSAASTASTTTSAADAVIAPAPLITSKSTQA